MRLIDKLNSGTILFARTIPLIVAGVTAGVVAVLTPTVARAEIVASDSFEYAESAIKNQQGGVGWAAGGWKSPPGHSQYLCDENLTYLASPQFAIGRGRGVAVHGTGDRNNPLRRALSTPYSGDELYVRFLLRYDSASLDNQGPHGNGEFFVLWLDDLDGGDGAGHNPNVPNIGINALPAEGNATQGQNVFMARIGAENTTFSAIEVKGDHTYLIVARISKTQPGPLGVFDHLELWVDPEGNRSRPPDAVAYGRGSNLIRWVGFSTGKKTELTDFVLVDELTLGERWEDVVPGADSQQSTNPAEPSIAGSAPGKVDFRRDVYPVLQQNCFDCHQGDDAEAGYRLDLRDELLGHYQGKPLVITGDSENSLLTQVLVTEDEDMRMPLGSDPLSEDDIAVLRAWIEQGVDWDEKLLPPRPLQSDHWAFEKIRRPAIPERQESDQAHNPIDAFIAAKHRKLRLTPAPHADRRTLLRRLALIYTGLPPTPEELDAFLADQSVGAYRKVVDRLLSSPHYGERWGRHWLDLARWAESDGHQHDEPRPDAWRYRNYVIRSFAENKPYDQFVREQLAGDELEPYSDEKLIATGFLAAGRYSGNELDKAIQRNDIQVDIANTTGSALLGLTIHCAQCHTHKFDPITARDYYRFMGFFVKGQPGELLLRGDSARKEYQRALSAVDEQYRILEKVRSRLEAEKRIAGQPVFALTRDLMAGMSAEQKKRYAELGKRIEEFEQTWGYYSPVTSPTPVAVPYHTVTSPLVYSPSILERTKPVLLIRGDVETPGQEVDVGWPAIFGEHPDDERVDRRPRTALADWLFDHENPLTARVWVNRIWQYHFGRGLVTTPDDFGTQGARPTHPELLDWLAAELIESGWNTAHIQRLIVESDTFQQSSQYNDASARIDPDDQYYWRWAPRRLEAEAIRDAMLAVSGLLDRTVGGPSVPLKKRERSTRRTLYLEQKRGDLPFVQKMFDAPSTLTCTGERRTSTVPLQPLFLLNDSEMYRYAQALAERVTDEVGPDQRRRAVRAFEMVLGRPPTDREDDILTDFLVVPPETNEAIPPGGESRQLQEERFVQFCHGLLNLNEFFYIP